MMRSYIPLTCLVTLAVLLVIVVVTPGRSVGQQPRPATDLGQSVVVKLKVPEALHLRHEAFQTQFAKATREQGKVGEAARAIENLANTHFANAKDVFPALGLLPLLSEGKVAPAMAGVRKIADHLRTALPQIRQEHRQLVDGLKKIAETAQQEEKAEYVGFAERLILRIQEEEEVLYPAVLVVGEYVSLKLDKEKE